MLLDEVKNSSNSDFFDMNEIRDKKHTTSIDKSVQI